jgi:hypothetical protein
MYESDRNLGLGLDPQTLERMRELFSGTCCKCGSPAERLAGDRFYCGYHFPVKARHRRREPRVYRCTAPVES